QVPKKEKQAGMKNIPGLRQASGALNLLPHNLHLAYPKAIFLSLQTQILLVWVLNYTIWIQYLIFHLYGAYQDIQEIFCNLCILHDCIIPGAYESFYLFFNMNFLSES
ncbi:hypothetical protein ACJX0J_035675, partial [Zea mays]